MDGELNLHVEGTVSHGTPVLDENGFVSKYELKTGQARNLQGFDSEFVFFTPAILYLHGKFRDAPFADLMYMTGREVRLYYKKFAKPVFEGLEAPSNGNPDWNHVLWAVRADDWQLVSDWLVSITLSYSDTGEVAGVGEQSFTVVDPLAEEKTVIYHGQLRRVTVYAFGLNGSRFRAYFKQPPGPLDRPKLVFDNPAADMKVFASALFGGANPVDARTIHRRIGERGDES